MRGVVVLAMLLAPTLAACGGSSDDDHYCTADTPASVDCQQVPTDADKQEFCSAGAAFSESKGFGNGREAAEALARIGTPEDITESARLGFVELVERMADAENGPDFRSRTRTLSSTESEHLLDLDTYIGATC